MSDSSRLFRKVALDRLSSPDRLDALLPLKRPQWPLVWAGAALAVLALLFWAFEGRVAHKVAGRCVLISPEGVAEITGVAAGQVSGLELHVGDRVAAGQPVARIVREDLAQQIALARQRVAALERRQAEVARFGRTLDTQGKAAESDEAGSIDAQMRLAAERAAALQRRVATERQLLAQGLITRQAALDTEEQLSGAVLERERLQDRAKQASLQSAEEQRQRHRERVAVDFQVNEARRNLDSLLEAERQTAPVVSPYAGRVIEVKVRNGMSVAYGAALVQIERSGEGEAGLDAAIYLPGGEAKLITGGMEVEVVPDHVKRQEFGFLRGRVTDVSEYPVSTPGIKLLVANDNLIKELGGSRSPLFARARLDRQGNGGFVWSAAASQPPEIHSGALCNAEVKLGERRPLDLAIPTLRRWFGLS